MNSTSSQPIYIAGYASHIQSEAIPGALPIGQNAPQNPPLSLYAEQLNGSAFTRPRAHNLRSWLYRIKPSVCQSKYAPFKNGSKHLAWPQLDDLAAANPNQLRWDPLPFPHKPIDFLQGWTTWAANGCIPSQRGAAIHLCAINSSMREDMFFYNADGELLFVPQSGELKLATEFGILIVAPGEIAIIPRGIKFQVLLLTDTCRYYLLENFGLPLQLPELGPIGANGLANPRDFLYPTATYIDRDNFPCELIAKYNNVFWRTELSSHPLNVVAWHGNYAPYKYDLRLFNTIGSISYDHPDPSIFTVLTSPSAVAGIANVDLVIFPDRWLVAEHTFRPPYYHRNIMSEFMGLIYGEYDAKPSGFLPGGASLHNCMSPHGPDAESWRQASNMPLNPQKLSNTLAFMFESANIWHTTAFANKTELLQQNYQECWQDLPKLFNR